MEANQHPFGAHANKGRNIVIACGVEIKSNEAILAVVKKTSDGWVHLKCDTKKLLLKDDRDSSSLVSLKSAIEEFARHNKIDIFILKSRQSKGSMSASGVTFKIESLFQISGVPISFVSPQAINKISNSNAGGVPTSVLAYQRDAYRAAICHISK